MTQWNAIVLVVLHAVVLSCSGCAQDASDGDLRQTLVGTWVTPGGVEQPRATEWGPMTFEITFGSDGIMTITMTSISSTGELDSDVNTGPYQVTGQQFVSELINKGDPVRFAISGHRLVLHILDPDEQIEFVRK